MARTRADRAAIASSATAAVRSASSSASPGGPPLNMAAAGVGALPPRVEDVRRWGGKRKPGGAFAARDGRNPPASGHGRPARAWQAGRHDRDLAGPQPRLVGRAGAHPHRERLLRRERVPVRPRGPDGPALRGRAARRRVGPHARPPAVSLRARHAVVGAAGGAGDRPRLLRPRGRGRGRDRGPGGDRRPVRGRRRVRRRRAARRPAVRHHLHRPRGAELAARHPPVGGGRWPR